MPAKYSLKSPQSGGDPVSQIHVNPSYTPRSDVVYPESVDPAFDSHTATGQKYGSGVETATWSSKGDNSSFEDNRAKSDDETETKDKKEKQPMVGVTEVFRFSLTTDRLLMFLGTICACAHGAAIPLTILIFGEMSDAFIDFGAYDIFLETYVPIWNETCVNMTMAIPGNQCENVTVDYIKDDPSPPDRVIDTCLKLLMPAGCEQLNTTDLLADQPSLTQQVSRYSIIYAIIACCALVVAYGQVVCWQTAAFNQSQRIRTRLFASILKQEIGWFDTHEVGELNTRLSDDMSKIEGGIGDKFGLFIQYMSGFVTGIVIGFVYSWKLTLVTLSVSPLLVLSGMAMGKAGSSMTSKELKAYARAGAIAEEVFGAIRTVMAFGGESKECERYNHNLSAARDFGIKKGLVNGISMGTVYFVMFGSYALGFWYGSDLVFSDEISAGNLMTVFFCVLIGTFYIGNAAPNIQTFAVARGAAFAIFGIIDTESRIDCTSQSGHRKEDIIGNVEFNNVHFKYPSRPDVQVLQGLSMKVGVGQTVALVGSSGCGKSTTVQLLQRFYDPEIGTVTLDGMDVREYNVTWLRQQIGVVSQEPVLFGTTIAENVKYGQEGIDDEDVIKACQQANAHDFISKLPDKYETFVGERGTQLSGGQKQRIAIARALVSNPKILLLDEATSALDTESEATVQTALDVARMGRTTLVVAHRLSTIRTADVIIGVKDGQVVEQGTHDELMTQKGLYHELVMNQEMDDEDLDEEDIDRKPKLERLKSIESAGKAERGLSFEGDAVSVSSSKGQKGEKEELPKPELKRIIRMNSPEWPLLVMGCVGATMVGAVQPAFAVVFGDIIGMYATQNPEAQDKVNLYSGMFAVMGVGAAIGMVVMNLCFSRSGEYLTMRIRELSFMTILRQDMSYFDDHQNSVGALCTRLATDASAVQGATGVRFGMFCQAITAMGAGVVIGFVYSWEMTLAILAFAPIMLASGFIQMKVMSGNEEGKKAPMELAGKVAMEAISNIRTVATLTREQTFVEKYIKETTEPHKANKKKAHVQAAAYAFSQAAMIFAHAACFQVGAYLVENRGLSFEDMFKVFSAIIFGASQAGEANSFTPNYSKAKVSAAKIFALLDQVPLIDGADRTGKKPVVCQGNVQLRRVSFNYPTRPHLPVLRGLDLDVTPGKRVALVGSSGCGKSTTVQLLQRFYDPLYGSVRVEGEDIPDLNIQWLRSQMGIVSQEPMLFDCSIRENIAYGDNSREVSMNEIIQAAKNANIHSFIESLPQGYDTNVGDKGAQLSGGQKQRVAIARALVRNPKILLLDEATSALDTESEKVVQAALDRAQEGRTCIVIAHRLSTIQNADCIVVIHQGQAVEMGTHSELLQKRGRYYKLNNAQLKKA